MDADDPPRDKEERLHTLFQPFHRGRNINETPGTGLGLRVVDAASTRATDRPTDEYHVITMLYCCSRILFACYVGVRCGLAALAFTNAH